MRKILILVLLSSAALTSFAWGQQTLSVTSASGFPGDLIDVSVRLSDGSNVGGVQFTLSYSTGVLSVFDSNSNGNLNEEIGVGSLVTNQTFIANANVPGQISVVIAGTTSLTAGSGSLIHVTFRVSGSASPGTVQLSLGNIAASDPIGNGIPMNGAGGSVTVLAVPNAPPTAVNDSASVQEDSSATVNVTANDSDPDGNPLTVTAVGVAAHGTTSIISASSVRYSPAANYNGSDSFTYTVSDGKGGTASAAVSVVVAAINDFPTGHNDSASTQEDKPVTITVLSNDEDPDGDPLTVTSVASPQHGTAVKNGDNSITYTPAANFSGADSFSYSLSDGNGGTSSAAVTVTVTSVNDVPTARNDSATTPEGQVVTIAVLANDADDDGDSLTVSAVGAASHGTAVKNANNTVSYTPAANFSGSDTFTYTITDGKGGTASAVVTVTVTAVTEAPVANDDLASTAEDSPVVVNVAANDTDADGDSLSVSSVTQPQHGTAVVQTASSVRYTPSANYHGSDSFTYTISDGTRTAAAQVLVTITSVNDIPVAVVDGAATLKNQAVSISVLANDSDVDGDALTVTGVTQPQHGSTAIVGGATVLYTPASNFTGSDLFSYTVGDGHSGTAGATVTVTVTATNEAPAAVGDAVSTPEDQAVVFNPVSNDLDPDGDPLSVKSVTQPAHGTVVIESPTSVRYSPAANYNGADSFAYVVKDPAGLNSQGSVAVTVTSVNDAPVAVDDESVGAPGQILTIAVLSNDSDVDGDQLSISSVSDAPHGNVVVNAAQALVYTPADDYVGSDTFSYTINDGNGGTASAVVRINPTSGSNEPPQAVADAATTLEDRPVAIQVLGNDSDPDGDILSVSSLTVPRHGSATLQPGNSVLYTPSSNYNGSDSFEYTLVDGKGGTATGQVTVTVTAVNDPPLPASDTASVEKDGSVLVSVLSNDQDPDGDVITVSQVLAPQNGTAVLQADGQILYTPSPGYVGSDSFQYEVSDGREARSATVSVQVVEQVQQTSALVFPVSIDTGASDLLDTTYVGVGLLNPGDGYEVVNLSGHTRGGRTVGEAQLAQPLPPKGQIAFLTGELEMLSPDSVSLSIQGSSGPLKGFFMVGDYQSRRMDGIGAQLEASKSLYFPIVHEGTTESTLIQLINPSAESNTWLSLELCNADGKTVRKVVAAMAPGGSFMGTLTEIFGAKAALSEGFVRATADQPVSGFEIVASRKSLTATAGRESTSTQRVVAPHFFVDAQGGTSVIRLLSAGSVSTPTTVRVYNDSGEEIAEKQITLAPGRLTVLSGEEILGLDGRKPAGLVAGSVEVETASPIPLISSLEFLGFGGRSRTTAPMIGAGYEDVVFPQVAQTGDGSIFTGLAVLNPGLTQVSVVVEAYSPEGQLVRVLSFELAPKARKVDILAGEGLFGPGYEQVRGHLRVRASGKVASFAIFGDSRGEFLSTIEGQQSFH